MIRLTKCAVKFDEAPHKYYLHGRELSGITGIIHDYLFPDMYAAANVSEKAAANIEAARNHGSKVHKEISNLVLHVKASDRAAYLELCEKEVTNYQKLVRKNHIKMIRSEYLVSDYKNVASAIDLIDKDYNLYDIKTTDKVQTEYVRWQLSIYAYLFKLQNKGRVEAKKLYVIHLHGDEAKIVEVERIPEDLVKQLLNAYATQVRPEDFVNPLNSFDDAMTEKMMQLKAVRKVLEQAEADEAKLMSEITACIKDKGSYEINGNEFHITRSLDGIKNTFDSKKFQADHPKLYSKYVKTSPNKGRLTITWAKHDETDTENN